MPFLFYYRLIHLALLPGLDGQKLVQKKKKPKRTDPPDVQAVLIELGTFSGIWLQSRLSSLADLFKCAECVFTELPHCACNLEGDLTASVPPGSLSQPFEYSAPFWELFR